MEKISISELIANTECVKYEYETPKVVISFYKSEPSTKIEFSDYLGGLKFAAIIAKLQPHYDTIWDNEYYIDILTEEEQDFLSKFWENEGLELDQSFLYIYKFNIAIIIDGEVHLVMKLPKEFTFEYLNNINIID